MFTDVFLYLFSEWCDDNFLFMFLSAGMYHVFLLIKDGFFHITNLALAKIETGLKILCAVDLKFCCSHFC